MAEEQVVVFRLGKEEYSIPISQVREIIQYNEAIKLPNTPRHMEGVINLRGKIIPVIELAAKFGLTTKNKINKRAIIIETAGQEMGIVVDEVTEVISLQDSSIEAAPTLVASNDYIRGIGKNNGRLLILLDVERLFDLKEMQELQV